MVGGIMISWLRRISPPVITSQRGSALPVVLIFAVAGLITVVLFLQFTLSSSKYSFDTLNALQVNLNARSGVYIAFDELSNNGAAKNILLPEIDARDSSFGKSLFNDKDSSSARLSSTDISENNKLTFDSGSKRYRLYSLDTLDSADVTLISDGGSGILRSVFTDGTHTATVEATLGSRIPFRPDTVAVCYNTDDWDASGVTGTTFSSGNQPDSVSMWLRSMVSKYQEQIVSSDTGSIEPPITIQSNRDLSKIKRVVSSDLVLDGSFNKLVWRDTGTFIVLGRMDVSSDVAIEGIKLVVRGEITLNGESILNNVSLFSQSKIFFADDSKFSGNAMALNSVAIYGNAEIRNKSTILVCGESMSSQDTSGKKEREGETDIKKIYSIEIGDKAVVDGVLIAVGNPGDIKTHEDVVISGVMIAQKEIGHLGKFRGLMTAGRFVDPDVKLEQRTPPPSATGTKNDPKSTVKNPSPIKNIIKGDVESLHNINDYKLPFFIGKLTIVKWREF
jgi:hypothetical protein